MNGTRRLPPRRRRPAHHWNGWLLLLGLALGTFVVVQPWAWTVFTRGHSLLLLVLLLVASLLAAAFSRRVPNRVDPWCLAAAAFTVGGSAAGARACWELVWRSGNLEGEVVGFHVAFALLGVGYLLALISLVSLHFRPRRHGLVFALCSLLQTPFAAGLLYVFFYGPQAVDYYYVTPSIELVALSRSWSSEWKRDSSTREFRLHDDGRWYGRIGPRRPPWGNYDISDPSLPILRLRWYPESPVPDRDDSVAPLARQRLALLAEPAVAFRRLERGLRDLHADNEVYYAIPPLSHRLEVVFLDEHQSVRRFVPLVLVPPSDLEKEALAPRFATLRLGMEEDGTVAYDFQGRVEPEPSPIVRMVADHWDEGGVLVLDVDPEIPWRVFVDFLDRTGMDSPPAERVRRVALAPR